MMSEDFFERLKEKAMGYFEDGDGHGFDHVQRVHDMAVKISEGEKVDMDIVRASALLHDVARSQEKEAHMDDTIRMSVCHAELGAKMAIEILKEMNFPEHKVKGVSHAIDVHRFSKGLKAETREAEILQDADRLDALGANILVRMLQASFSWGIPIHDPNIPVKEVYDGSKSTVINHIYEKILKITPESFKTSKAKKIAEGRYEIVKDFKNQYVKEWEGKA